jgi:outer membrane receptor protein involved in Fe transport
MINNKEIDPMSFQRTPVKGLATWLAAIALLVALGLAALPSVAHAQAATGSLSGRVIDDKGAPLPGVTINATEKDTGFNRTTVTAADGSFRLPSLPVGVYTVSADLAGFSTVNESEVKLTVATERKLEITLNSAIKETINVVAETPLVQTSPEIGAVISQTELENLPLNGRQFANLATLAPGTTLSVNSDPTKPGQQVVALNGGTGRNVNYLIDGGDNTDDTIGGALQNFNIESVKEFKIQTMQYKAEFGRSSGGILSVVTKSGTNRFEGAAWEFRRDKSLNTETTTEQLAGSGKQPFKRDQYGASIGGPIVQDKLHFFATWEKTKRDTSYTVNAPVLPSNGSSIAIPFTDELGTAKVLWDISSKQYLQVRYGYQKNADKYGAGPLTDPTALGTIANDYKSILAGHQAQIGSEALNEALFQHTHFKNTISADSNLPALNFPTGAAYGQSGNTPQSTEQTKNQFKDDFSWSQTIADKRHDFKVGLNYIDEPTLSGDFSVGTSGIYTLSQNSFNAPVTDITIFGGFAGAKTPVKQYSGYAQDDWALSNNLTLNVGLRYDIWKGFDLDQRSNPIWQTLSTQTKYNESYLKDFQGGKGGVLKNDTNNFGPRIGFTWDTRGDGKRLLRGGWGRYFDFPYTNATILFPANAVQSNYGVIYNVNDPNGIKNPDGSFFHPGQPLPPNQLPGSAVPPPNEVASPTLATPRSDQASLGYSFEVNNWLGFNLEAVDIRYNDIPYRFRANVFVTDPDGTRHRRFPQFGNFRIWYGNGEAKYDGFNLGVHARLQNFELQGFYTLSRATGNVLVGVDEFRLTAGAYQPDFAVGTRRDASVNPLNPQCGACFGPLDTDARHRVTLAGSYRAPHGFNFSGVFRYHSGTPYTALAGSDVNGDGFSNDLAPGVSHVNSLRFGSFEQFDVRIAKEFKFADNLVVELIGEVFNVFNAKNPVGYSGNVTSARFGRPAAYAGDPLQGEQRLAQLGLRFRF